MPVLKDLLRAVKTGNTAQVRALLDADPALVNARDAEDSTPLHYAAWKGHPEVTALLLERGADVHAQNTIGHWGGTPLHAAAHANQRPIAEMLIAHGADVNALSCNGRRPLAETAIHKATAAAKVLRQHGATE
jgi:ankyrin repeat protein